MYGNRRLELVLCCAISNFGNRNHILNLRQICFFAEIEGFGVVMGYCCAYVVLIRYKINKRPTHQTGFNTIILVDIIDKKP